MPDEVLQIDEVGRRAEAARERIIRGGYHATVHRAEMLQQVRFLLEHGNAESTCKWFLARVHSQVSLQVPRHAELLAAVAAPIFTYRSRLGRVVRRRRRRWCSGGWHGPGTPGWLQGRRRRRIGARWSMWRRCRRPILLHINCDLLIRKELRIFIVEESLLYKQMSHEHVITTHNYDTSYHVCVSK